VLLVKVIQFIQIFR